MSEYIKALVDGLSRALNEESPMERRLEEADSNITRLLDQLERLSPEHEGCVDALIKVQGMVIADAQRCWNAFHEEQRSRSRIKGWILVIAFSLACLAYAASVVFDILRNAGALDG